MSCHFLLHYYTRAHPKILHFSLIISVKFSSVQLLSHVRLFATPWTGARQASLSITNSRSLLKLMSIESVMPSKHLILCWFLLLRPSIFPSIRVFSNESALCIMWPKYWSFSFLYSQLSHPYMTTGKTIALTRQTFVGKDLCKEPMTNKAIF